MPHKETGLDELFNLFQDTLSAADSANLATCIIDKLGGVEPFGDIIAKAIQDKHTSAMLKGKLIGLTVDCLRRKDELALKGKVDIADMSTEDIETALRRLVAGRVRKRG